jgi:hypothetical protein
MYAGLLPEGGTAQVDGRNYASTWLWVKLVDETAHCWLAASAVIVHGDLAGVPLVSTEPPINTNLATLNNVQATRNNDNVTVTWDAAEPALDLHYLIRAKVCSGGNIIEWQDTTLSTSYTLQDQDNCSGDSSAKVYMVNRLGYSTPVEVPWPQR